MLTLVLAELALRIDWRKAPTQAALQKRLAESQQAGLDAGRRRFSLFGLVQASEHADLVYELKPGLDGRFRGKKLRTNLAGQREDRDYEERKPEGVYRIVGLGDSVMFGWGVRQGDSYLDMLEARLADRPPHRRRYEVINCAVPGYNTTMEVASFEHKCRKLDPDLVLIHFVINDFGLPVFLQPARESESGGGGLALVRLIAALRRPTVGVEPKLPDLLHPNRREHRQAHVQARKEYRHMLGAEAYRLAMDKLVMLAEDSSAEVWSLMLLGSKGGADGFQVHQRREVARRVGADLGLRIINPVDRFARHLVSSGLELTEKNWKGAYEMDEHPTRLAHDLWASELYEALVEDLPGTGSERTGVP